MGSAFIHILIWNLVLKLRVPEKAIDNSKRAQRLTTPIGCWDHLINFKSLSFGRDVFEVICGILIAIHISIAT